MRILELDHEPVWSLPFLRAGFGGSSEESTLPFLRARVDQLPEGVEAVVVASDLQGRSVENGRPGRLLGLTLAEELVQLAELGLLPAAQRVVVWLAGDYYTVEDLGKRGGHGDVAPVLNAFAEPFAWVAAVLGNHDRLEPEGRRTLGARCHVLDEGELHLRGGLRIAGVGGIIGRPTKPNRRTEEDFFARIRAALREQVQVLLLHEGPCNVEGVGGNPSIRSLLERESSVAGDRLVVFGHRHWFAPLDELGNGTQLLNVEGRVVLLVR